MWNKHQEQNHGDETVQKGQFGQNGVGEDKNEARKVLQRTLTVTISSLCPSLKAIGSGGKSYPKYHHI
jgi:hypothetical protein